MGLMLGMAIGLFLLIAAAPLFGRQSGAPDVSLGVPMFAAAVVPWFLSATTDLTRDNKLVVMLCVLGVVAVTVSVTSAIRLRRHGE